LSVAHRVIRLFNNFFSLLLLFDVLAFGNSLAFLVLSVVSNIIGNNLDVNTFGLFTPVAPAATSALLVALRTTSARDVMIILSLATS
jgi:hypothetical protein